MELVFVKNGIETTAQLYNSSIEAGESFAELFEKNGQKYYVALGEPSNNLATYGRLLINGVEKTILQHKIEAGLPYTEKAFTEAGNFTFIVPTGVTKLRIALCGGGAGGMIDNYYYGYGESGGGYSSYFGDLRAYGGDSAYADYSASGGGYDYATGAGTSQGEQGYALGFDKIRGEYGSGGLATLNDGGQRGGGYAGHYLTQYLDVSEGQNFKVTVGAGGEPAIGTGGDAKYGNSGFVLIAYGGDIK